VSAVDHGDRRSAGAPENDRALDQEVLDIGPGQHGDGVAVGRGGERGLNGGVLGGDGASDGRGRFGDEENCQAEQGGKGARVRHGSPPVSSTVRDVG
jgi:hypothetical protein